ncbi:phage portal protein [Aeromonas media]|uniref:phage portal protein n=1 Tax=Aeromonas media TaxID=651 RepID=UPI0038D1E4B7
MLNKNLSGFQKKSGTGSYGTPFVIGSLGDYSDVLKEPTILACLRVISQTISSLPLVILESRKYITKYDDLSVEQSVILRKPNKTETLAQMISKLVSNLVIYNEAFLQIKTTGDRIRSIECIPHGKISRTRDQTTGLWVFNGTDNQNNLIISKEIHYITGPRLNDSTFDLLNQAKSIIELSTGAIDNASKYHAMGPKNSGFLVVDGKLNDEQFKRTREQMDTQTSEPGKIAIVEKMQFVANPFNMKDSLLTETRDAVTRDLAALMGVPLPLINIPDSAFKDISEVRSAFLSMTVNPIVTAIEDAINEALDYRCTVDFSEKDYLNSNFELRSKIGMEMFKIGLINKNEARNYSDMSPLETGGDQVVVDSNNLTMSN